MSMPQYCDGSPLEYAKYIKIHVWSAYTSNGSGTEGWHKKKVLEMIKICWGKLLEN